MPARNKRLDRALDEPAVCDLLPVRDYLDSLMVRTSGALVAGFQLQGAMSYFADDEGRNEKKRHLEALLRTIPEESMRLQFRFEVAEDLGLIARRVPERDAHVTGGSSGIRSGSVWRYGAKKRRPVRIFAGRHMLISSGIRRSIIRLSPKAA